MTGWGAFFAGLWAFLKGIAPHLWESALVAAGMLAKGLQIEAENNAALAEQRKAILDEERAAAERPAAGAAERLRRSKYTKPPAGK